MPRPASTTAGLPVSSPSPSLPTGWRFVRVDDVIEILRQGPRWDARSVKASGLVPVLDQTERGIFGYHDGDAGVQCDAQNVVVTFANHTCNMRLMSSPFSTIQNVFAFRGIDGVSYTKFLYFWLRGRITSDEYKGFFPTLRKMQLLLPPLDEQRRIAGVLGGIDDLIKTNEGLIRDLRSLVGAVLASLQISRTTDEVALGEVFTFKEGQTSKPSCRVTNGGFPIMGANGPIGRSSTPNSSQSAVVLGKIGSAGALNVTSGPSWITNNAFEVLPREPWSRELVLALLQQVDFGSCIGGSANPYMPRKNFEHVKIALPTSLDEVSALAKASEEAIDGLSSEVAMLLSTRDELLPLLMSGQVRVEDVAA